MSSLIIDCYIDLPIIDVLDDGQPIFHRVALPEPSTLSALSIPERSDINGGSPLIVTNASQLHSSEHTTVYRASLDLDGDGELIDAVLKVSNAGPRNDAFLKEYQGYNDLAQFQGSLIPRCYGLFQAVVADEQDGAEEADVVSCLVLSYGGVPSSAELNKNSKEFNLSVIKALETLHDAGFTHGAVQASNILNNQGAPMLIDLEFAKSGHKCGRSVSVTDNRLESKTGDIGCSEIYNVARKMDLWKRAA